MMKKYICLFVLLPLFIFAKPPEDGVLKLNSYNLDSIGVFPNYKLDIGTPDLLTTSDLILTGSGGGSGSISITNNVLTVAFSGSWSPQVMKTGIIKTLTVSPSLPDMDLGPILTNGNPTGYNAKIENNSLVFYSPFFLTGISTTVSAPIPGGAPDVSIPSISIYSCTSSGGGGSGSFTVSNGIATLYLSAGWANTCNIKTGPLVSFGATTIPDVDFGILPDGKNNTTAYGARIVGNSLVIYLVGTMPALPSGCNATYTKDLGDSGVVNDNLNNWVHAVSYDSKGNATGASRTYFDVLGKPDVSLSKDYVTNKIWGTETIYDNFGRPDKSSFIAPSPLTTFDKYSFFKTQAEIGTGALLSSRTVDSQVTVNTTVQAMDLITGVSAISSGLTVNFNAKEIILKPGFIVTATAGSSFKATPTIFPDSTIRADLANYYSDSNTLEPYQATAAQPYSQTNYDTLNPGNVINVVGGNKINGVWKTGCSYTVPAAQEMYYVYGSNYYEGAMTSSGEEVITKFYKTVSVDANGVENVAFTDGEGKVLATARSGGAVSYPVVSLVGTQGFVDVHIPTGISNSDIVLLGPNYTSYNPNTGQTTPVPISSLFSIYDLQTGQLTTSLSGGHGYRLVASPPSKDPKTYIKDGVPNYLQDGASVYDPKPLGISYRVNYYDYAVNVYNKTGQLIKAIQPQGYKANATIVPAPVHMTSANFATTYLYNAMGQVVQTTSSDEGISRFAYRKDGQIRYSQSELQNDTKVSYTDYDTYGRPTESGVITIAAGIWTTANANADTVALIGTLAQRSEQTFTVYDESTTNQTSVALPTNLTLNSVLTTAGIPTANYMQNNLSGNVAVTYTKPGASITAITWYSYDIYGRTEWMVQYNEGIGAKTIHYYYDYKGNVKRVIYQKDKAVELFVHQYTYDANDVLKKVETSTNLTNIGTPNEAGTFINHAEYSYYQTGELKRVQIAEGLQGLDYVYTLGGQLKSINHPSLEAAKDPGGDSNDVFGLTLDYYNGDYLRTGRNITSSPSAGADYVGNIKAARWANKGVAGDYSGSTASQKGYLYNYDRNNRLTGATYGNADATTAAISTVTKYKEAGLTYDANGNIITLQRTNEGGTLQDNLTYKYNAYKNQLNSVADAVGASTNVNDIGNQTLGNYQYDSIGRMIRNTLEDIKYSYNTQGLVKQVDKGANAVVKFFYNERGQRIKKESYNTASPYLLQSTDYYVLDLSGNVMSIYNQPSGGAIVQKDLPIFGLSRLGVYNRASAISSYEITDHLGNVRAVVQKVSGSPVIKSFADYYPFGELLPNRNSLNYRYAFQGQELDGETNMEAFQLRLWDGRIGRWLSTDPAGQYASPYLGMGNNPIGMIDFDGAFARWFKLSVEWTFGIGIDEIKISKYLKGSLSLDFIGLGTNSDAVTNANILSGKAGINIGKFGANVNADVFKAKFNKKEDIFGIPSNYEESTFGAISTSYSLGNYLGVNHDELDILKHIKGKGFQPVFQATNSKSIKVLKHIKFSDTYDVGASLKIIAVDVEAGINFKELGEDIYKGIHDFNYFLMNGWGPNYRPLINRFYKE